MTTYRANLKHYQTVEAWIDGASKGNPGPGGYGIVLRHKKTGTTRYLTGAQPKATNNQMELVAAIRALQALKMPCMVVLYTDSQYLARGWNEQLPIWRENGWQTTAKKPVKNIDLWQQLIEVARSHVVTIKWVQGHADCIENLKADELASGAARHCATTGSTGPWSQAA
ncbi:MAG: ribonuclease HI [Anaerolineae bacterium]|nr:ribonuclease HI [Anaerolineae bacterium]